MPVAKDLLTKRPPGLRSGSGIDRPRLHFKFISLLLHRAALPCHRVAEYDRVLTVSARFTDRRRLCHSYGYVRSPRLHSFTPGESETRYSNEHQAVVAGSKCASLERAAISLEAGQAGIGLAQGLDVDRVNVNAQRQTAQPYSPASVSAPSWPGTRRCRILTSQVLILPESHHRSSKQQREHGRLASSSAERSSSPATLPGIAPQLNLPTSWMCVGDPAPLLI